MGTVPGRNALVVEDDADIRQLLVDVLERAGFAVATAADGPAGLAAARATRPHLVVLDVRMPGMTGLDVCARLRAHPDTAALTILMLTACAGRADVEAGMRAGADEYLLKPFSPRELVSRIEALLERTADRTVDRPADRQPAPDQTATDQPTLDHPIDEPAGQEAERSGRPHPGLFATVAIRAVRIPRRGTGQPDQHQRDETDQPEGTALAG